MEPNLVEESEHESFAQKQLLLNVTSFVSDQWSVVSDHERRIKRLENQLEDLKTRLKAEKKTGPPSRPRS